MRHLTLAPLGGLCNRLRALLSARSLIEIDEALTVRIAWEVNADCGARFDALFGAGLCIEGRFDIVVAGWQDRAAVWRRNLRLPQLWRKCFFDREVRNFHSAQSAAACLRGFADAPRVYISTGSELCTAMPELWQSLRPQPHLMRRIEELSSDFDRRTVGVHIRRTDHVKSVSESPLSAFERAMHAAVKADGATRFYLATDDDAVRKHLERVFPGRMVTQHAVGGRGTLGGMEAAVVDLYALSRTARLLGSYWSSFTDTAAELGGMPLDVVRK